MVLKCKLCGRENSIGEEIGAYSGFELHAF